MKQQNGDRFWEPNYEPEYKCFCIYYGVHNGIYGRGIHMYKMLKIEQWQNYYNKRYLFRRYINQYFRI